MTKAIEIGTKRSGCEVLFPQAGGEEIDVESGVGIDALEHVYEVDI